jgi:hypothetical protein
MLRGNTQNKTKAGQDAAAKKGHFYTLLLSLRPILA